MEKRTYGYWEVLKNYPNVKVKELSVDPGQRLSMQRHKHRNEFWFVAEGTATINTFNASTDVTSIEIPQFHHTWIQINEWHQLENKGDTVLKIVEIQWGDHCDEEDIERII